VLQDCNIDVLIIFLFVVFLADNNNFGLGATGHQVNAIEMLTCFTNGLTMSVKLHLDVREQLKFDVLTRPEPHYVVI